MMIKLYIKWVLYADNMVKSPEKWCEYVFINMLYIENVELL